MACVRIKYPLKYPLCPSKFPLKLNAHSDSTDQAPTKHRSTTDQAQEIILSMSEYYMTMNEIMTSMRLKHRTSFREKYFLPALEDGAIELQYPEQPKYPKQKYRLTEVDKEWSHNNTAPSKS